MKTSVNKQLPLSKLHKNQENYNFWPTLKFCTACPLSLGTVRTSGQCSSGVHPVVLLIPPFCWDSPVNKQKKAAHPYIRLTRHPSEIWFDPYTAQSTYVVRGIFCFPCRQSPWACPWQGYNSSLKQLDHHRSTRTQWGGERVFSVQLFGNRVPGWAEHIYLCLPTSTPSAMNSTYGLRQPQVPV